MEPLPLRKLLGQELPETTYQWEPYGVVYKQMAPFLAEYWRENEPHPDASPFDPDFDLYFNLERDGRLGIFTARRGEIILGFNSFFISTTFARRSVITAVADILYLRPAERGGAIAIRLIRDCEKGLVERKVKFARYTPSSAHHLGPLLIRAGYAVKGGDYEKVLR